MNNQLQFNKLVSIICFFLLFCTFTSIELNAQFWTEDFETDGTGTRYTTDGQFIDSPSDFFGRVLGGSLIYQGCDPLTIHVNNAYTGEQGDYFMAGEDLNDGGGCGTTGGNTRNLIFATANNHGININGASQMTFSILVAVGTSTVCNTTEARWDAGEGIKVFYNVDGTGEVEALCFAPDITCGTPDNFNEPLRTDIDCDGNGNGGTSITNIFTDYSFIIPSGGTTLEIRVQSIADASSEEFAYDYLTLSATTPPVPLPIKLSSFDAKLENKEVKLNWSTSTEINNQYFSIERSTDGRVFESIGKINGSGNSSKLIDYSFIDSNPLAKTNYYRLKQIDFDGKYSYSPIASVNVKMDKKEINIYPNPTSGYIQIEGQEDLKNLDIQILDYKGIAIVKGWSAGVQELDLSELPVGIYFLQMIVDDQLITKKIMKQ